MLLEVLQGFALRHVVRIFFEVTKPEVAILPVNIPKTFHAVKIQLRSRLGNSIVSALGGQDEMVVVLVGTNQEEALIETANKR